MRYIKHFELFEGISRIKDTINNMDDILLPLRDRGFNVVVSKHYFQHEIKVRIRYLVKNGKDEWFSFSVVRDEIEHLVSYMKDLGYSYEYSDPNESLGENLPQDKHYILFFRIVFVK